VWPFYYIREGKDKRAQMQNLVQQRQYSRKQLNQSTSALGQKQTLERLHPMSALPPKADIVQDDRDVRLVPKADIRQSRVKAVEKLKKSPGSWNPGLQLDREAIRKRQ
jgi:hypothetical protein